MKKTLISALVGLVFIAAVAIGADTNPQRTVPGQKLMTVNSAGTPIRLGSTDRPNFFKRMTIIARRATNTPNTGQVRWGWDVNTLPFEMEPDDIMTIWPAEGVYYDMRDMWGDADVSGDGFQIIWHNDTR